MGNQEKDLSIEMDNYKNTRILCNDLDQLTLETNEARSRDISLVGTMEQNDSGLGNTLDELLFQETDQHNKKIFEMNHNRGSHYSTPRQYHMIHRLFCGDEDGDTLLHISILHEDEGIVNDIIQSAPDFTYLNISNDSRQTALHFAVLTRQNRIVRRLICAGAALDVQDNSGNTPLHLACGLGYCDIVKELLKPIEYEETLYNNYIIPFQRIPQDMQIKNYDGHCCLHLAVANNRIEVVRFIVDQGIDLVHFADGKSGRTPMHLATETGNVEMLSLLITQTAADVDIPDFDGLTSFQLAFGRGDEEAKRILLDNGATFKTLNFDDFSDED